MNFRKKGWLKKYTDFRSAYPLSVPASFTDNDPETIEKSIYSFLQPTGLLYGFPLEYPSGEEQPLSKHFFTTADKAQLIFLDCLFTCMQSVSATPSQNRQKQFEEMCELLSAYFDSLPKKKPAKGKKPSVWAKLFGKSTDKFGALEEKLHNHLNFNAGLTSFSVYFANSLLFLDIYGCMRYSAPGTRPLAGKLLDVKAEQQQLRVTALKLIAAAAHANGAIAKEESQIYFQFLRSANITEELSAQLRADFDKGITLEEIEIPQVSWLAKRYFLEVAILTIMADKDVSEEEEVFLWRLCGKLQLPAVELEQAMAALQTFLIAHEPNLHFFKSEVRFSFANESLKNRIGRIINQNKERILTELQQSSEINALLQKAKKSPLTTTEMAKIKSQLMRVLAGIPTLGMLQAAGKLNEFPNLQHLFATENLPEKGLNKL